MASRQRGRWSPGSTARTLSSESNKPAGGAFKGVAQHFRVIYAALREELTWTRVLLASSERVLGSGGGDGRTSGKRDATLHVAVSAGHSRALPKC